MTLVITEQKGSRSAMALAAVCLSALMFGLEISSVPAVLPTLEQVLHADFRQLQWIMNAYTIGVTMVLMATGALADRYGRKRVFIASIAAFALSSLACGMTQNVPVLIGARFFQGLSGGAMLVCQIAILSHQFRTARERGMAFGWWGIISGVGLGFGPVIGGAIVALWSWEWVFLVHVALAIVTWLLASGGVRESRDPEAARLFESEVGSRFSVGPKSLRTFQPDVDPAVVASASMHRALAPRTLALQDPDRIGRMIGVFSRPTLDDQPTPPALATWLRTFDRLDQRDTLVGLQHLARRRPESSPVEPPLALVADDKAEPATAEVVPLVRSRPITPTS